MLWHFGRQHCRHLPTLHIRYSVVWVQNKCVDIVAVTAAFDGGRTGIARGRPHHHHFLVALGQQVVQQMTEKLRSEEHTSELQSRGHHVCRLLLEKKKNRNQAVRWNNMSTSDHR